MKRNLTFVLLFGMGLLAGQYLKSLGGLSARSTAEPRVTPATGQCDSSKKEKEHAISAAGSDSNEIISALVSAFQEKQYLQSRVAMFRLIEQIPLSDIPAILDSTQRLPLKVRKDILAALIEHWSKLDTDAACEWVKSHSNDPAYLEAWAHSAPLAALTGALTELLALNRDTYYWEASKTALHRLAGNEPDARIALLASLPASANRDMLLSIEIEKLAKTNPANALRSANTRLTGELRKAAVQAVLIQWVQIDPATAAAQLAPLASELTPGIFGDRFISDFTWQMAEKDVSAALEFASGLPDELRKYPLIGVASQWAKADPLGALAWSLENGVDVTRTYQTERSIAAESVLRVALKSQPWETIDWLTALPEGPERQQLIKTAFQDTIWNPYSQGHTEEPGSSLFRLFDALVPADQARMAGRFGWQMVEKGEFPDQSEWQARFADENIRARAMAGAVGAIFSQSANRGEALLASLPHGPTRDLALKEVVYVQRFSEPELATKRTLEIQNKEVQRSALDGVVAEWLKRDEAACRAWLDSTKEIPASWVSEWLSEVRKR